MRKPAPIQLPLGKEESVRFLPWLIAFMAFLATLALAAALLVNAVAERWDRGLDGRLTIQVPHIEPRDAGQDEARIDRVLKVLTDTDGLREAEAGRFGRHPAPLPGSRKNPPRIATAGAESKRSRHYSPATACRRISSCPPPA